MAKGTGARRHVHKYFRLVFDGLWHCGEKNCTHFMPGNMPKPIGKDSICWICGRPFELNADHLDSRAPDHPTCDYCPTYDVPRLSQDEHEDLAETIERQLREARMKRLKEGIPVDSEESVDEVVSEEIVSESVVELHERGCGWWEENPCTCGLEKPKQESDS